MRILLEGLPGIGKGTLGTQLEKLTGIKHISSGDTFKDICLNDLTPRGDEARKVQDLRRMGLHVPDDLIISLMFSKLDDHPDGFILDGFPGNEYQARSLHDRLRTQGSRIDKIICLRCDPEVVAHRIVERAREGDDLDPAVIDTRIQTYVQKTRKVVDYFSAQPDHGGITFIDALKSKEEVLEDALANLGIVHPCLGTLHQRSTRGMSA